MRSTFISAQACALFTVAALTGCVVAPYDNAFYDRPDYGDPYHRGIYSGGSIHQHGQIYPTYPRHPLNRHALSDRSYRDDLVGSPRPHVRGRRHDGIDLRDWRDGDGEFHRRQRERDRVGLEERHRRDRQERMRETRRDSADRSRDRRRDRQLEIRDRSDLGFSERLDHGAARRLERATEAERQAQRRAAEVRQRLRAERQAEREILLLQRVPSGDAQIKR